MNDLIKSPYFQIIVFGAACYVLSLLTRRCAEAAAPSFKRAPADVNKPYPSAMCRWWNEVILYAIPPAWGIALAMTLRKTEFFPGVFKSWQAATLYGVAFGFLSGLLYKVLKRILLKTVDVQVDDAAAASTPAPSVPMDPAPSSPAPPADPSKP